MKKLLIILGLTVAASGYGLTHLELPKSKVVDEKPIVEKKVKTKTKKEKKKEIVVEEEPVVIEEPTPVAYIEETVEPVEITPEDIMPEVPSGLYSGNDLRFAGAIYWSNYKWTWYSERVLPGGGLNIPGRHADEQGFICDGEGYICLASSTLARGTVVSTPFGKDGKIYDSGCAAGILDVYVNW